MSETHSRNSAPTDEDFPEPPRLRALRRLVTALTVTLMVGVLAVAAALVIRIAYEPGAPGPAAIKAEAITLPGGETPVATGYGEGAIMISTVDAEGIERLRIYDAQTGEAVKTIMVERGG